MSLCVRGSSLLDELLALRISRSLISSRIGAWASSSKCSRVVNRGSLALIAMLGRERRADLARNALVLERTCASSDISGVSVLAESDSERCVSASDANLWRCRAGFTLLGCQRLPFNCCLSRDRSISLVKVPMACRATRPVARLLCNDLTPVAASPGFDFTSSHDA